MNSDILKLIKEGESEQLELKGPRVKFDVLAREVCGLLNQQGGVLLWGVYEDKPVGVSDAEDKAGELVHNLMNHINPRPFLSVSVEPIQEGVDKSIIVVRVPPGSDKPYSFNRQIWVRLGKRTMRAGEEGSAAIVEKSAVNLGRWEREPMPGFEIDSCDKNELSDACHEIETSGRFGGHIPSSHSEMLERLYLRRGGRLTNAAAVLFADQPRMWSPSNYLRITSYAAEKSGPIGNDIVIAAPAVYTIREVINIIQQRTGFSGNYDKNQLERKDRPAYSLFALRECLVNAVAHRSYDSLGGSVRVEIHPDRLVISNPGHLPEGWTAGDLKKVHRSVPFNPDIANVLYMRGLMEQLGVGTQRVAWECKELGAKPPVWKAGSGTVSVTLHKAPEPVAEEVLTGRLRDFVESASAGDEFKVIDYVNATGVGDRQARRDLVRLENMGLITRIGKGRATLYRKI